MGTVVPAPVIVAAPLPARTVAMAAGWLINLAVAEWAIRRTVKRIKERFQIPLEVRDLSEDHIPMSELVAEYWKEVGIFTSVRAIEGSLYTDREAANDIRATATWTVPEMWVTAGWDDYLPTWWAPGWQTWFTSQGEGGEEPTPEAKELFELHTSFMAARPGTDEFDDAIDAIFASHRENIWTINPVEEFFYTTFWSRRIQNVPEGVGDESFGVIANIGMEQWFIDEDA
jgi:peptide/nickel transport system substrate-binding protein